MSLLINIDVDDLQRGIAFYRDGLGLRVGRDFGDWVELVGASSPVYLLPKPAGSDVSPKSNEKRSYERHWTPVHLDFVVDDIDAALERALKAGAKLERDVTDHAYGKLVLLADPFGNGFCLLQFNARGYDAIAAP